MYIPIVSQITKCIMPVGLSKIVGTLENNMKYGLYQIGSKAYLSVFKQNNDDTFDKGYLAENDQCNLPEIGKSHPDLSTVHDNCKGAIYKISNIVVDSNNQHNVILKQAVTPNQNGTANIFGQDYDIINDNMFSQNDIISFLGLEDCSVETATTKLQEYYYYLQSLIPTTTTTTTTTESPIAVLKNILDSLGNEAYELLKEWGYITDSTPTPCPTPSPNDKPNDGGYTGVYIAGIAVSTLAVGAILGYAAKHGWDWYKRKNLDLVTKNKDSEYIELLHKNFKDNSVILDKIVEIYDLSDVIKIARSNEQYEFSILPLTNLNNEIVKLNSPSGIAMNLDSASGILHEICKSLGGSDSLNTISDFATLITTIRTVNTKSNEYNKSITTMFEIFNPHYTDIAYQQDCTTALLAKSSPSDSSGIGIE